MAIRDADGLWLFARISRAIDGSVSVSPPRDDRRFSAEMTGTPLLTPWNPHATYHASGEWHIRSYKDKPLKAKPLLSTQRQKLDTSFRGAETVWPLEIQAGEAASHDTPYTAGNFNGVFEIPIEKIPQGEHHTVVVDLVEPGKSATPRCGQKIVDQKTFRRDIPWILVTLWRGEPRYC